MFPCPECYRRFRPIIHRVMERRRYRLIPVGGGHHLGLGPKRISSHNQCILKHRTHDVRPFTSGRTTLGWTRSANPSAPFGDSMRNSGSGSSQSLGRSACARPRLMVADRGSIGTRRSTASSSTSGSNAGGINSPIPYATTTSSGADFSGSAATSSSGPRPCWPRIVTGWAPWTGSGRRPPIACRPRARSGGKETGKHATDLEKSGTKRSIFGYGRSPGAVIAEGGVRDRLAKSIGAAVVERPHAEELKQHPWQRACYGDPGVGSRSSRTGRSVTSGRPATTGWDERRPGRREAHRWVVERTSVRLSTCCSQLVATRRMMKDFRNVIGLAYGLLWYRRRNGIKSAW
jgi:hypothetical protein